MRKTKRKGKSPATGSKRGKKGNDLTNADTEMATTEPVKVDEGMPEVVTESEDKRVDTSEVSKVEEGVPKSICADEEKKAMESDIAKMDEGGHENVCGDEEKRETTAEPVEMDERVHEGSCGNEVKREVTSELVKMDGRVYEDNCANKEKREMMSEAVKTDEGVHEGNCGEEENREMKSELVKVDASVPEGICNHEQVTSEPVKMDEEISEDIDERKMTAELVKVDEGSGTVCEGDKKLKTNETEEGNDGKTNVNILNEEGNESKVEKEAISGSSDTLPTKDTCEPKTLTKHEDLKKADSSMGMIFMCNSRTKRDCFHYNVLGMPSNKKELVAKIYKGMRLFVFDIDLRLMYGIYKAAGPGGYKIEPKAFQSAFPSQVRFTVLEDCLPLPEEKFKAVINDNYYGKKKFDCQLKPEQVKNLCKLFQVTTRERSSKQAGRLGIHESLALVNRYGIEERHHVQQEVRYPALGTVKPFSENAGLHERGVSTSAALSLQLPGSHQYSLPPHSYSYERLSGPTYHRRDAEVEHQQNGSLIETGHGHRDVAPYDPYILQRTTQSRESFYPTQSGESFYHTWSGESLYPTQSGESFYPTQSGESFYHMGLPDQYPPSLHEC